MFAADELGDALAERMAPILAASELTATQFRVLYLLIEQGPMTPSALATQERCVKSNITYITRAMLRAKLVVLTPSADDQRARVITASPLGRRRYGAAKAGAAEVERALRRAVGAAATAQLERACLAAAAALDRLA